LIEKKIVTDGPRNQKGNYPFKIQTGWKIYFPLNEADGGKFINTNLDLEKGLY
jgi:hypothetical protein